MAALLILLGVTALHAAPADDGLVGHWALVEDCRDSSGRDNHGQNHGVTFTADGALFDGVADYIEVPGAASLALATGDFTVAVWVHTEARLTDVLGDVVCKYDPKTRTGAHVVVVFILVGVPAHFTAQVSVKRHLPNRREQKTFLVVCCRNKIIIGVVIVYPVGIDLSPAGEGNVQFAFLHFPCFPAPPTPERESRLYVTVWRIIRIRVIASFPACVVIIKKFTEENETET